MYKLGIVDDEEIIRESLRQTVKWDELGYEVVGTAENGEEALRLFKRHNLDVILTDVKMPLMDGLVMSRFISEQQPNVKIVISSGYNEPQYLQDAIKSRVYAYLLKPNDYDEFEEVFRKLKLLLDKEKAALEEQTKMRAYLRESLPHMKERFFMLMLSSKDSAVKHRQSNEFYGTNIPAEDIAVVVFELDNYYETLAEYSGEKTFLLAQTVCYMATNEFKEGTFYYSNENEYVIGVCGFNGVEKRIIRLQAEFKSYSGFTVSAGISGKAALAGDIAGKKEEAELAIKQKVFLGDSSVIFYDDILEFQALPARDFDLDKLINVIMYKSFEEAEQEITKTFSFFEKRIVKDYKYIDKVSIQILLALEQSVGQPEAREDIFDVFKIDSVSGKKEWLLRLIRSLTDTAADKRSASMGITAKAAVDYIQKNFTDNSMSLEKVAGVLGKNPSYLSNLFKLETNKNFSEYVTDLRMQRAKLLLANPKIKVYEIAQNLGYADVSNFNKVFKKNMGISPVEYRNSL